ncbi:MAG: sulfatase-like hydrolase/transferase [Planctomycetota bacterium]
MPDTPRPTRVIWITSDHMRYDHVAANGNPAMVTPALDRIAASSACFHRCYTQNPLCMPSRCSFMTGMYPPQTGVTHNGHCLPADFTPTVATAFRAAGYATAQIGKLHFQPHDEMDFDAKPRHTYGFDVFWPIEERGNYSDAYYHWLEGKHPQHAADFRVPRSSDPDRHFSEKTPQPVDAPWQASQAGWIVDAASRYLSSRQDTPQFVHLGFYNPHPPLTPVREAWDAYDGVDLPAPHRDDNEAADKPEPLAGMLRQRDDWGPADFTAFRKGLAAMVTEMDFAIGWLLNHLTNHGLLDDTLLVFSSDHGDFAGDHGITHKGPAYYDEVMRVPLMLHWPNGLGDTRRDCDGLIEMVDLLPTLLGLCSAPIPAEIAGRSVADALLAGQAPAGRADVFAYHDAGQIMLRTDTHKYLRYEPWGSEVLYDLAADPHEFVNVADAQPETLAALRERALVRALAASTSAQRRLHPY